MVSIFVGDGFKWPRFFRSVSWLEVGLNAGHNFSPVSLLKLVWMLAMIFFFLPVSHTVCLFEIGLNAGQDSSPVSHTVSLLKTGLKFWRFFYLCLSFWFEIGLNFGENNKQTTNKTKQQQQNNNNNNIKKRKSNQTNNNNKKQNKKIANQPKQQKTRASLPPCLTYGGEWLKTEKRLDLCFVVKWRNQHDAKLSLGYMSSFFS